MSSDDIEWFELEPGLDFDDEGEYDGERAVMAWSPDVDVDAMSLGTVYQLDDGRFKAEGNDEFTGLRTLGYFDSIEEAEQAVINSMEADGWLPYYEDATNQPSKHTGTLPTRKAVNMNYRTAGQYEEEYTSQVRDALIDAYRDVYECYYSKSYSDHIEFFIEYKDDQFRVLIDCMIGHSNPEAAYVCRIGYASTKTFISIKDLDSSFIVLTDDPRESAMLINDEIEDMISKTKF